MSIQIPRIVAQRLGYYVYLYLDPRTNRPFYVGKGKGERVLAHLSDKVESEKKYKLDELSRLGLEPTIEILAHCLRDEETALRIEAAVIDLLGLDVLTNKVHGWQSIQLGRLPLSQLVFYYAADPVTIDDPALLIRINKFYRHGMSDDELYEATRGVWKLGEKRNMSRIAMAVFEGVVREVYAVESWHKAGTTPYRVRNPETFDPKINKQLLGRWEFIGRICPQELRSKYYGKSVESYFKKGAQSPVIYVNIN